MPMQTNQYSYAPIYAVPSTEPNQSYVISPTQSGYAANSHQSGNDSHISYGAFYVQDSSLRHAVSPVPPPHHHLNGGPVEYIPRIYFEEHEPAPVVNKEQQQTLTRLQVSNLRRSPQAESPQDRVSQYTPRVITDFPSHSTPTSSAASPGSASLSSVDVSSGSAHGIETVVEDPLGAAPRVVPSIPPTPHSGKPKQDRKTIETKSRDKLKTALDGLKDLLTRNGMPGHQTSRKARFLMNATNFIRSIVDDRDRLRDVNRDLQHEVEVIRRERDVLAARLRMNHTHMAPQMHGYMHQ